MPLIDSGTGRVVRTLEGETLAQAARVMRGHALASLQLAGSGHAGGTLSVMDIAAALYLNVLRHDPHVPNWPDRDRVIWSAGHKAPALYVSLGASGYFDLGEVATLRKLGSPFQGHPHHPYLPGIEFSTGSLGQGLSIAVGQALARRLTGRDYRVFCILGDGEHQEGQVWEAAMEAGHYRLGGLVSVVDVNGLQIDGRVCEVMEVQPLADKCRAFGWEVVECDGHDVVALVRALERAAGLREKPVAVLAHTVKGKGVDFMENQAGWHGKAPSREELARALEQLGLDHQVDLPKLARRAEQHQVQASAALRAGIPRYARDYAWNGGPTMRVDMEPTRLGFGRALSERGDDPRVVCLGEDISGSIAIAEFYRDHPERRSRFFSMGIAEQSSTAVAAGLAKEGLIPVIGSYGVFAAGRALDQLRTTVCYGNFNVLVAGAHGGVSVGPDGATHQALEDLFQVCGLPGITVAVPCDARETERTTEALLFDVQGPKFLRFAREATPVVTTRGTPFRLGLANTIRFRGEAERFVDAFEVRLARDFPDEHEDLAILACGPVLAEAMRAAWILKTEFDLESRVLDVHTVKPIDEEAVVRAARETGVVVTVEEHQTGGFGHRVLAALAARDCTQVVADLIGVDDRFGESGGPWELIFKFGLSAEHVAARARALWARRPRPIALAHAGKES
ncbi:MAG TPA: transketolase [Candidatus Eisenbacteria bacterium]|jgi:transketolase